MVFSFVLILAAGKVCLADSLAEGLYAEMQTNKGTIFLRLYYDQTPVTVANFVGLATGLKEWTDSETGVVKKTRFYDGLVFHRAIAGLMIQGGDPTGTGRGGPGYQLLPEIGSTLRHDRAGRLSMLNKGALVHGSQFLITLKPASFLDDKHTLIGEVVDGQAVVSKLQKGDRIIRVSILRRGAQAKAFDLSKQLAQVRQVAVEAALTAENLTRKKTRTPTGIENKKNLPALEGPIDARKIPGKNQSANSKVALEYILITYQGARSTVEFPYYSRDEARVVAQQLTNLARLEGADFARLARQFSDATEFRLPILTRNKLSHPAFEPVFHLKEEQISDPIDGTEGYYIFKRVKLELITVRHILIAHQDARGRKSNRTRVEARALADRILTSARAGADFSDLARTYSDSNSANRGGLIQELYRGKAIPAFEQAAFALQVNDISGVTSTPAGFQIIKRIE